MDAWLPTQPSWSGMGCLRLNVFKSATWQKSGLTALLELPESNRVNAEMPLISTQADKQDCSCLSCLGRLSLYHIAARVGTSSIGGWFLARMAWIYIMSSSTDEVLLTEELGWMNLLLTWASSGSVGSSVSNPSSTNEYCSPSHFSSIDEPWWWFCSGADCDKV